MSSESSKLPALFIERDYSSTERSLLDVSTKRFHVIKNPSFQDAKCLCGKGQWLLMSRGVDRGDTWFSLFLLNPVSRVRVDLPTVRGFPSSVCTFSLSGGSPDLIVSVNSDVRRKKFFFRIMRAGDAAWEEHSVEGIRDTHIVRAALFGRHVLCVDPRGIVVVFDLLERSLNFFTKCMMNLDGYHDVIECDEDVVMVDCPMPFFHYFRFTRFDWGMMNWVELGEHELENANWFLEARSACVRKWEGKKVYTLLPNQYADPNQSDDQGAKCYTMRKSRRVMDNEHNVYVHDLVPCDESVYSVVDRRRHTVSFEAKTTENLLPDAFYARHARWVGADILC